MTTPTVYARLAGQAGAIVTLTGKEFHYLAHVLRVQPGDAVRLADAAGLSATATVVDVRTDAVRVSLVAAPESEERGFRLTLVASGLKHGNTELLAAKAAELGVSRLVFYRAARTVAPVVEKKIPRLEKVVHEAARQVGRITVPEVLVAPHLDAALTTCLGDMLLFLWEDGGDELRGLDLAAVPSATCVIGPEGGFTADEAALLLTRGARPLHLRGAAIRAETAAIVGAALLLHKAGKL